MTVFYVPIHKIMASEKSIKRVVPHVTSSGTSYEIDFDFAKTDVPEHQIARVYGTIITDSRFSGVIKSAKYIVEAKYGKGDTNYACEVRPDRDGYPVLISTTVSGAFTESSGNVHPNIISRTEFEDLQASTIKDEDFRLTAFGLPEPVGIVWDDEKTPIIQSTPLYVWLFAGAGGFAILAITFAYLRRRVLRKRALTVRTGVQP